MGSQACWIGCGLGWKLRHLHLAQLGQYVSSTSQQWALQCMPSDSGNLSHHQSGFKLIRHWSACNIRWVQSHLRCALCGTGLYFEDYHLSFDLVWSEFMSHWCRNLSSAICEACQVPVCWEWWSIWTDSCHNLADNVWNIKSTRLLVLFCEELLSQ